MKGLIAVLGIVAVAIAVFWLMAGLGVSDTNYLNNSDTGAIATNTAAASGVAAHESAVAAHNANTIDAARLHSAELTKTPALYQPPATPEVVGCRGCRGGFRRLFWWRPMLLLRGCAGGSCSVG